MAVLLKEIEWFADNKIPYIDVVTPIFGIFPERDLELASNSERKISQEAIRAESAPPG